MEHRFKSRLSINGPISYAGMERGKRGQGTPTRSELQLTMSPGLIQACNTTSLSQYDITPQIAYHVPFYFSTSIPVQPHYPEAIINGDVAETWDMNTACRTTAGQIDEQSLHTIEENNSRDKEDDEQYVVWNRSGFSLIRRGRSLLVATNTPTPNQHAQGNHQPASLTHEASVASILTSVYQSRPPTGAGVYPTPASDIDTDWMPSHQDAPTGPIRQQASSRGRRQALQRVYDKPGNKPAVAYEPDLLRLQELSRRRGGQDFAIAWILKAFTQGVTVDALRRTLSEDEINAVDHDHGFRLSQAYDGFLEKVEDRFECGLCTEEKRANWKNKKDAVRHFQKFHFGTGQTCGTW